MHIRKSEEKDLEQILGVYEHARQFMREHGNPRQWNTTWPPKSLIEQDIREQKGYVCVDDEDAVLGCFYFTQGLDIDPSYRKIEDGAWKDDSAYGVVHRIASSGKAKGVGSFCLNWAFDQIPHIRIDTHGDNKVMQNMLQKNGFEYCGIIYVEEDNDPRLAFEKSKK